MQNTWTVALYDLRVFLSNRGNLVGLLIMPIVMTLVLGFGLGGDGVTELRVDVINLDAGERAGPLLDNLRAVNDAIVLCPMDNNEEDVCGLNGEDGDPAAEALTVEQSQERVLNNAVLALIVIPEDYSTRLAAFEDVDLDYYSLADATTGDVILQALQAALQRVNGSVIAARVGTYIGQETNLLTDETAESSFASTVYEDANNQWTSPAASVRYVLTESGEQTGSTGVSGFSQSVPGMGTMFVLFTVLGGISLLIRERQQWTLQRLVVMPISRAQLLGGKILARFLTGILQFLIIFGVGLLVGMNFGSDFVALILVMVAYTLCATALTFAIAPFIRTEAQANSALTLVALVLASLGGAWWPLDVVPDFMRIIGHFSPIAWAMDAFNELLFYGGGLMDVLVYLGILLGLAVIFFVFGVSRFKYE